MKSANNYLVVEASGEQQLFRCPDCGNWTRQVWGFVESSDGQNSKAYAVYYVRWTDHRHDHGAAIALSIGGWESDDARPKVFIGMECVFDANDNTAYRFVDADKTPWAQSEKSQVLGQPLRANEVLDGALLREAMTLIAAIEKDDPRYRGFIQRAG